MNEFGFGVISPQVHLKRCHLFQVASSVTDFWQRYELVTILFHVTSGEWTYGHGAPIAAFGNLVEELFDRHEAMGQLLAPRIPDAVGNTTMQPGHGKNVSWYWSCVSCSFCFFFFSRALTEGLSTCIYI